MIRRLPRYGLPVGGLQVVLAVGAAHFAHEHEQGKHERVHVLCPICWLNKIAPAPGPSGGTPPTPPE